MSSENDRPTTSGGSRLSSPQRESASASEGFLRSRAADGAVRMSPDELVSLRDAVLRLTDTVLENN